MKTLDTEFASKRELIFEIVKNTPGISRPGIKEEAKTTYHTSIGYDYLSDCLVLMCNQGTIKAELGENQGHKRSITYSVPDGGKK